MPSVISRPSAGFFAVGPDFLPSYLTQKAYPANTTLSPVAQPQGVKEKSWWERITTDGFELARSLLDQLGKYKQDYDYFQYSQKLQTEYEAKYAAYDIQRLIYDARGRAILPNPGALVRREGGPVSAVEAANNVYDYSGFIFDFFKRRMGFVIPQPMLQIVNYNDNTLLAGYDNAHFNVMKMGLSIMVYGTGDGRYFKSFDRDITIIAHELAHNFTSTLHPGKFSDDGTRSGQPGALSEHVADVIGKCVEAEFRGWDDLVEDWFIGANIMVNPNFSLRDMRMPGSAYNDPGLGKDRQPDHMKNFVVTNEDHGGVHINCGIMNRLFALFCEEVGGAVYDIPLKIWLKAIETVEDAPTFLTFAQALQEAASLYGVEEKFLKAAAAVGVLEYMVFNGQVVRINSSDVSTRNERDLPQEIAA